MKCCTRGMNDCAGWPPPLDRLDCNSGFGMKHDPDSPLISVIVPAFNVAPYIERCLASILAQTYPNLEIIVVNDCSTDSTGAMLASLSARDSRLKILHQKLNLGVHEARAAGTSRASGDYIGYVDGDDWIDAEMYAALLGAAEADQADIAICGAIMTTAPGESLAPKVQFRARNVFAEQLLRRFCRGEFGSGVLWNKLYRSELIRPFADIPLEPQVMASEDYIVNVGAFASARRVVTLPPPYYHYFVRAESGSRRHSGAHNFLRLLRAYVVCLETYQPDFTGAELSDIDALYGRQFQFNDYRIGMTEELVQFNDELQHLLLRLAAVHPRGIYALVHAFDALQPNQGPGIRRATRNLITATKDLARGLSTAIGSGPRLE